MIVRSEAITPRGYWNRLTNGSQIVNAPGKTLCLAPHVIKDCETLSLWNKKMLESAGLPSRRVIYALVQNDALLGMAAAAELKLGATMPVLDGHSFCVFDTLAPSERGTAPALFGMHEVSIGEAMGRVMKAGYYFDVPTDLPSISNKRFRNRADALDLVRLTTEAFGDDTQAASRLIYELIEKGDYQYLFAIRNAERRIVSFRIAEYLGSIPFSDSASLPVFQFGEASTFESERGKGLMTALMHVATRFVEELAGSAAIYSEIRANGNGAMASAMRAGFRFGGSLPSFDSYRGETVAVNFMYFPGSRWRQ